MTPAAGTAAYAAIEAGGTKFVCALGTGPADIRARAVIRTAAPAETLAQVAEFFDMHQHDGLEIRALGIASFGPVDVRPASPRYGRITTTPKRGWEDVDLLGTMRRHLDVPTALDSDVNGAAFGEYRWGSGRGLHSLVYVTVGTGIGGGAVVGGKTLRGLLHPEMGHLHVERHPDDSFSGTCPFHGDCLEGLASGPAILARTGRAPEDLGAHHDKVVELEAWYLSQLVTAAVYLISPERVVVGGGVSQLDGLLPAVRWAVLERLAGALDGTAVADDVDSYVVQPALGSSSGVLGAMAMAELAYLTH